MIDDFVCPTLLSDSDMGAPLAVNMSYRMDKHVAQ